MFKKSLAISALFSAICLSQSPDKPKVSIQELPPEPFPTGICTQDVSGYIGIKKGAKEETKLTDTQLGEYVRVRLSQGYSLALYPQVSGKIYSIANCVSIKR